jgi:LppP/LprE lipoprotein
MRPATAILLLSTGVLAGHQGAPESWLDRPLSNWNSAGASLPSPPRAEESKASLMARCPLTPPLSTLAEKAVDDTGWIPFHNFDQRLAREDVEIVGGMAGSDGMCRPTLYNAFVFVGGRFAGTWSPVVMTSRLDASSGAVRMPLPQITAEFARYKPSDPLCCPSSRMTVRYRIDRGAMGAVVVPVEVRTTRG